MLAGRPASAQYLYSMDPRYKNVTSYWVYPNDAADIKIHPFFKGTRWNELYMTRPPYIPRVKGWEDTRYFDDWKNLDQLERQAEESESEEESDEDIEESTKLYLLITSLHVPLKIRSSSDPCQEAMPFVQSHPLKLLALTRPLRRLRSRRKEKDHETRFCGIERLARQPWRSAREVPSWDIRTVDRRVRPWP